MSEITPQPDMAALAPFIGEWHVQAVIPGTEPDGVGGWATFEWILGGAMLLERSGADHPAAPDAFIVVVPDGDAFRQHYFDSRGVLRLYSMTFRDGLWTLTREAPDFTPLDFAQRYVGTFEDGGTTIRGRWEIKEPGEDWKLDFELNYTRRTGG